MAEVKETTMGINPFQQPARLTFQADDRIAIRCSLDSLLDLQAIRSHLNQELQQSGTQTLSGMGTDC